MRRNKHGLVYRMIEACIGPVLFLVWTAICAGLGLLPEIVMYLTYHLIAPEDFWQKLAVLGLFYLGGAGLCLIFGLLFSSLWAFGIANWGK